MAQWDNPYKNTVREIVTDTSQKQIGVGIFLPGKDCLCLRTAMDYGVIGYRTQLLLAERDQQHLPRIAAFLRKRQWQRPPHLHPSDLEHINLDSLLRGEPVDLAYLDYCVSLNGVWLRWLRRELCPVLTVGSHVIITVRRNFRRNSFVPPFRQLLADYGRRYMQMVTADLVHCKRGGSLHKRTKAATTIPRATVYEHDGQQITPYFHNTSAEITAAISLALAPRCLQITDCFEYSPAGFAGSHMVVLGFAVEAESRRTYLPPVQLEDRFLRLLDWTNDTMGANYNYRKKRAVRATSAKLQ